MAKPAPMPVEPSFSPVDALKDAFLFAGDFKWMFYVALAGFCAANARAVLTTQPKINYFHGCVLMVLTSYGGSTMAAIMCGKPVIFVVNEALVSVCLITWTIMYLAPGILRFLKDTSIGRYINSVTYEIMRCHVLMGCSMLAASSLPSAPNTVPITGPLIAGLLGGCGGAFMPLNKGLEPVAGGLNWRFTSAAINSLWLFLSTQFPSTKDAIGLSVDWARFVCVAFFVTMPLIQAATGFAPFGANPLVPTPPAATPKKKTN